jgi:hypothetical protein
MVSQTSSNAATTAARTELLPPEVPFTGRPNTVYASVNLGTINGRDPYAALSA